MKRLLIASEELYKLEYQSDLLENLMPAESMKKKKKWNKIAPSS